MSNIANLNPIRYREYYYDVETGFYYLQSRYYDPTVGRFINADALVSTGQDLLGLNMYAYCGNNPVNCFDPNGNSAVDVAEPSILEKIVEGIGTTLSGGAVIGSSLFGLGLTVLTFPFLLTGSEPLDRVRTEEKDIATSNTKTKDHDPRIHHIVAHVDWRALESRRVLASVGISINDGRNLIIIPQRYHVSMHTKAYYKYVNSRLVPYYNDINGVNRVLAELQKEILTRSAAGIGWDY